MTFNVTVRQHGSIFKQVTVDDRDAVKTLAEGFRMEFNLPIIFVGPCTFLPTGDAGFSFKSLCKFADPSLVWRMVVLLLSQCRAIHPVSNAFISIPPHVSKKLSIRDNITLLPLPRNGPAQSGRDRHLAIHARQLALKPRLQILRRHFGPLLLRLA
jgi:hypothetical protein